MPVMDGFETAAAIRRMTNPVKRNVPIVAVTAHALTEDKTRAISVGMNDHISKPVDVTSIISAIENWTGIRGNISENKLTKVFDAISDVNSNKFENKDCNDTPHWTPYVLLDKLELEKNSVVDLLEDFTDSAKDLIEDIQDAFNRRDYPGICAALHSFSGILGSIGANESLNECELLRKTVKENPENISPDNFLFSVQNTLKDIERYLKSQYPES